MRTRAHQLQYLLRLSSPDLRPIKQAKQRAKVAHLIQIDLLNDNAETPLVDMTIVHSPVVVLVDHTTFHINRGVRNGDPLSFESVYDF